MAAIAANAFGIDGGNVVGYYADADGNDHGLPAAIPESATLSLLALGMLLAGRGGGGEGIPGLIAAAAPWCGCVPPSISHV